MHFRTPYLLVVLCFGLLSAAPVTAKESTNVGAELDADRPIDGLNISRLLDDPKAASPHDEVGFYYYKGGGLQAVRLGKWKLHLKKKPELYDLRADIGESNNVADANADVVAKLRDVAARYDADLKANSRPLWRGGR